MEQEKHPIELKSGKLRNVMGEMPHSLTVWSNIVLAIITLGLLLLAVVYLTSD